MEDVDKLDNILDCFIHYQLLRFCQATRLQYLNGQVQLANQQVLQQQHVDHKFANALLKKGTREACKKWNLQDRAWVDMRLHESHDEGEASASPTTLSRGTPQHTRPTPGFRLPGHFRPPCSGGMAAGQRHPGSHHLERPFPSHAQAPARNSSAGLRLHGAAGCKPARTAISCGRQRGGKCRGATSTAVRSRPRRQFGHPCPSAAQPPP
jgi:hypothetical protein